MGRQVAGTGRRHGQEPGGRWWWGTVPNLQVAVFQSWPTRDKCKLKKHDHKARKPSLPICYACMSQSPGSLELSHVLGKGRKGKKKEEGEKAGKGAVEGGAARRAKRCVCGVVGGGEVGEVCGVGHSKVCVSLSEVRKCKA